MAMPTDWIISGIALIDETNLPKADESRFLLGEINMPDSNITKQAMANVLKELLEEQPFEKIRVYDICDRCHMNRKSFYYHFRDKYDLVNWIFDTEFVAWMKAHQLGDSEIGFFNDDQWKSLEIACHYFYENRRFYRKVLSVQGQNSLSSHFRELLHPIQRSQIGELLEQEEVPLMVYDFIVEAIDRTIELWLMNKDCVPVEEFMDNLKKIVQIFLKTFNKRIEEDPQWLK